MFGMVLAIGIVVDDAIVVIENVERIMSEEGLSPRDATREGDGPDHRAPSSASRWCWSRCSCRWRSSPARSATSTASSRSSMVTRDAVLGLPGAVADAGAVRDAAEAGRGRPQATRSAASSAGSTAASTATTHGYEGWVAKHPEAHRPLPDGLRRADRRPVVRLLSRACRRRSCRTRTRATSSPTCSCRRARRRRARSGRDGAGRRLSS